ncbi:DNA sulfur modification protein DndD [Oscillatoria sp. FACHB-1406]|uniref:DNA sulfur modification protein DndD n=1 Tax=Oscillatoria sp. FACHB-1406 TaxID=2692846 RepID=UPI001688EE4B|nr:DNA sulfur modification protein DndD [Oscillatoria sp. FACHB-1406]MBD2578946.1 DNA sulfur modification protein DndD [Oscillatoria sp. FACHB-1406]
MIFQELVLENFGPYKGRQILNLCPGQNQQTIILFGGLNGGGKTTLMDALRLALYGHRASCSTRGSLSYPEFLKQCINRQAQASTIELSFQQTLNNEAQATEFRIYRTWTEQISGRDTLKVTVNGELAPDLAQKWDERIEDLLPLGISRLFLFDGEQVGELADRDVLPQSVTSAIRSLLGLELPDRLSADLDVLTTRKRKALATTQQQAQLSDLEQRLESQEQERRSIKKKIAAIQQKLDKAEEKLRQAEERFLAEGGKIAAEQSQQEQQHQQARNKADDRRAALREVAAGVLPLALIQPLLKEAQIQAQQEIRQQQLESAGELLKERNQALLQFVRSLDLGTKQLKQIRSFLAKQEKEVSQEKEETWLGADVDTFHQLTNTLQYGLPHQCQVATEHLKQLQTYQEEIETIERYLATAASPEMYDKLVQQVRQAQAQVVSLKADREHSQRLLDQAEQTLARTGQELMDYSKLAIERKNDEHTLAAIAKVQDTLKVFQHKLKLRKLNQLESLVTECFLYLLHKSNLVHRVQIDTETFSLSLFDCEGQAVLKHRLSAGEKQLLAISLLWGLARASGRQLPVAIDTPLGRLDSSHRKNLVDRYFPQASHQVLLLSTDTEIGKTEVKRLRENRAIAREYLLKYDRTKHQTQVKSGYFR